MTSYEHKVKNIYLGENLTPLDEFVGKGFHVPTASEFTDLKSIMDGLGLTSGREYQIKLYMPWSGYRRYSDGSINQKDAEGHYFTSTKGTTNTNYVKYLYFLSSTASSNVAKINEYVRADGGSIRALKNEYVDPDSNRTVIAGTLGSAGIFHNATAGLISITNGSDKNITMKDKNEGAENVGDYGKYYQRGNTYGFPNTNPITTSSTRVNTSSYDPYTYNSSTFIKGNADRSNPKNDNLRTEWSA